MKQFLAKITISLRSGILDVQGKAVEHALHSIEYQMLSNVRIGKYVQLSVDSEDSNTAYSLVKEACEKLIANPIIEDFDIKLEEVH